MPFITPHDDINALIDDLLHLITACLEENLVGVYLCGSLVAGDFDCDISDIDLFVVTAAGIDDAEFSALNTIHNNIIAQYPQWDNRLEVAYVSVSDLGKLKTGTGRVSVISPGEPFNKKDAGKDWLIKAYLVLHEGEKLAGPAPVHCFPPISEDEFIAAIKDQLAEWHDWVYEISQSRNEQSYAILTMCRVLYSVRTGQQASKKRAALWAKRQMPEWSELIDNATKWRSSAREPVIDHEEFFADTVKFVHAVINDVKHSSVV